jgi:DNA (cytosine-5)-methyltransferase 1
MGGQKIYSAVSLFSGCGGSDLGLAAAGIETVWANERQPYACSLYEHVTGNSNIECADIRTIDSFPRADILYGCYPCQGYSQGGRRTDSDPINYLYREFDRALRAIRPVAFIVENVDGMRFTQNQPLLKAQLTRFRSAGYRVVWQPVNAKSYGLAQDRKRILLVGIRSAERKTFVFPEATHGDLKGQVPFATMRDVIWDLRSAPAGSFNAEPLHWYYLSRNRWRGWNDQARCVVAHWRHVGLHPDSPPLKRVSTDEWVFEREGNARRLSYLECAALQGFRDPQAFSVSGVPVRERFRAIGNAVPPPLFAAIGEKLVKTLVSRPD